MRVKALTLLGHVAVEVLLGPEPAEDVFGHMSFGRFGGFHLMAFYLIMQF